MPMAIMIPETEHEKNRECHSCPPIKPSPQGPLIISKRHAVLIQMCRDEFQLELLASRHF